MTASRHYPPLVGLVRIHGETVKPVMHLGHLLAFFVRAVIAIPVALRHYRKEFLRLL